MEGLGYGHRGVEVCSRRQDGERGGWGGGKRRTLAFFLEGQLALLVVILVLSSSAVLTALSLNIMSAHVIV